MQALSRAPTPIPVALFLKYLPTAIMSSDVLVVTHAEGPDLEIPPFAGENASGEGEGAASLEQTVGDDAGKELPARPATTALGRRPGSRPGTGLRPGTGFGARARPNTAPAYIPNPRYDMTFMTSICQRLWDEKRSVLEEEDNEGSDSEVMAQLEEEQRVEDEKRAEEDAEDERRDAEEAEAIRLEEEKRKAEEAERIRLENLAAQEALEAMNAKGKKKKGKKKK